MPQLFYFILVWGLRWPFFLSGETFSDYPAERPNDDSVTKPPHVVLKHPDISAVYDVMVIRVFRREAHSNTTPSPYQTTNLNKSFAPGIFVAAKFNLKPLSDHPLVLT